jgi:type IV pilus biogenesis protein CpaD/CtpE
VKRLQLRVLFAAGMLVCLAGCTAAATERAGAAPAPVETSAPSAAPSADDELLAAAQAFADVMTGGDKEQAKTFLGSTCTGVGPAIDIAMSASFASMEAKEIGTTWKVDGANAWNDQRGTVTGYHLDLPAEADSDRETWPQLFRDDSKDAETWVKEQGKWLVDCGASS